MEVLRLEVQLVVRDRQRVQVHQRVECQRRRAEMRVRVLVQALLWLAKRERVERQEERLPLVVMEEERRPAAQRALVLRRRMRVMEERTEEMREQRERRPRQRREAMRMTGRQRAPRQKKERALTERLLVMRLLVTRLLVMEEERRDQVRSRRRHRRRWR